jgi:hypothetical protein
VCCSWFFSMIEQVNKGQVMELSLKQTFKCISPFYFTKNDYIRFHMFISYNNTCTHIPLHAINEKIILLYVKFGNK